MSASLVGSEMCIRDRSKTRMHDNANTRKREHAKTRTRESANARKRAVSYTHLTLPTICSV
eukprot:4497801-Alexandrium_andersonii.AAC.1